MSTIETPPLKSEGYSTKDLILYIAAQVLGATLSEEDKKKIPEQFMKHFAITDCNYAHSLENIRTLDDRILSLESQTEALKTNLNDKAKTTQAQIETKQSLESLEITLKHLREEHAKLNSHYKELQFGVTAWLNNTQEITHKITGSPDVPKTYQSTPIQTSINKTFSEIEKQIGTTHTLAATAKTIAGHALQTIENTVLLNPEFASVTSRENLQKIEEGIQASPSVGKPM